MDYSRVFKMSFSGVYPHYISKAEKKGKTLLESLYTLAVLKTNWCSNDNEKASWRLRAEAVEKMIKDD